MNKTILTIVTVMVLTKAAIAQDRTMTVTAYSQGDETATQEKPRPGMVAVSRDLLANDMPFGSIITIDGIGELEVCDVMHKRKCKSLDVYMKSEKEAKKFGRKKLHVRIVRHGKKEKAATDTIRPTWNHLFQKR